MAIRFEVRSHRDTSRAEHPAQIAGCTAQKRPL